MDVRCCDGWRYVTASESAMDLIDQGKTPDPPLGQAFPISRLQRLETMR